MTSKAEWIDFKGSDGTHYALPYRELLVIEMPSSQEIILRFSRKRVVVRGRNLEPVYERLLEQRVVSLAEEDVDWASESETAISKLSIERVE